LDETMENPGAERHLTDDEIFALAAPAAGEPEALPRHLAHCASCGRALQEWKGALRDVGDEDLGPIARRNDEGWRAAEDATLAAIRRSGRGPSRGRALRWGIGIAASLLLVALAMPWRAARPPSRVAAASRPNASPAAAARPGDDVLSGADRDDDALLRDAAYLAQGGGDYGTDVALEESL
jgi:hypothetical protein